MAIWESNYVSAVHYWYPPPPFIVIKRAVFPNSWLVSQKFHFLSRSFVRRLFAEFCSNDICIRLNYKMSNFDLDEIKMVDNHISELEILRNLVNEENGEDPIQILNVGEVIRRHQIWIQKMPRVVPHYGMIFNTSFLNIYIHHACKTRTKNRDFQAVGDKNSVNFYTTADSVPYFICIVNIFTILCVKLQHAKFFKCTHFFAHTESKNLSYQL